MTVGKHFLLFYLEVLRKLPVEKENLKIYHVSTRSDSTEKYYTVFMVSVLCTVSSFTNYLLSEYVNEHWSQREETRRNSLLT